MEQKLKIAGKKVNQKKGKRSMAVLMKPSVMSIQQYPTHEFCDYISKIRIVHWFHSCSILNHCICETKCVHLTFSIVICSSNVKFATSKQLSMLVNSYPFSKGIFLSRFRIRFNMHAFNDTITAESISTGTDCSIEEMIP